MNALANTRRKGAYPTAAKIKALVKVAKELGLDVAGIEVSPDGAIRVVEARALPQQVTDFDRYENEL